MIDFDHNIKLFKTVFSSFLSENVVINNYKDINRMNELSESEKFTVSDKLIAALYKSSMNKYSMIDFGKIPDSKGDIERVKNIDKIEETIGIISQIAPDMEEIKIAKKTIMILKTYKKEFTLGFIQDIPLIVMTYNTITLSLFCTISLAMTTCLDYLRTPNGTVENSSKLVHENDSQFNVVVDNLNKFIIASEKGDLKKLFDINIKKENFIGVGTLTVSATAIAGVAAVAIAISIVPIIRELLYFFYNMRMSISEFFKTQASFLEINVTELRNNNGNKNVIKKQEARIKQLEKLANKFEVQFNSSNNKTKNELSKKIDVSSVNDSLSSDKDDISAFSLL